jgi:hypothetical protein
VTAHYCASYNKHAACTVWTLSTVDVGCCCVLSHVLCPDPHPSPPAPTTATAITHTPAPLSPPPPSSSAPPPPKVLTRSTTSWWWPSSTSSAHTPGTSSWRHGSSPAAYWGAQVSPACDAVTQPTAVRCSQHSVLGYSCAAMLLTVCCCITVRICHPLGSHAQQLLR